SVFSAAHAPSSALAPQRHISCSCPDLSFFFHHTATTEIYTLSLHDALPISLSRCLCTTPWTQPKNWPKRASTQRSSICAALCLWTLRRLSDRCPRPVGWSSSTRTISLSGSQERSQLGSSNMIPPCCARQCHGLRIRTFRFRTHVRSNMPPCRTWAESKTQSAGRCRNDRG